MVYESQLQCSIENTRFDLKHSLQIIRTYDWLINSYVLDFYQDNHWSKLPNSWRLTFESVTPDQCSELLSNTSTTVVWPLSILVLKTLFQKLCIPRHIKKIENTVQINNKLSHPRIKNIFTKCVKAKKRHEIEKMADICYKSCLESGVKYIVDFGAGLGHLARVLSYGYELKVCCLEMQDNLNKQSRIFDNKLEATAARYFTADDLKCFIKPAHVTLKLTKSITTEEFLYQIRNAFQVDSSDSNFQFGIIGLHPCGDLGSILIQLFLNCKEAIFLNLVSCCYMKLSTERIQNAQGYPLSSFLKEMETKRTNLSYESREIACHAIETYEKRLKAGDYENLKIHSFRAILEKILVRHSPLLKHSAVRSVKHSISMNFEEYCEKALQNVDIKVPLKDIYTNETLNDLKQWKNVVIFYTLRLFFAPLIESLILQDRALCLIENGCDVDIFAIFNPEISPRNHITSAMKKKLFIRNETITKNGNDL